MALLTGTRVYSEGVSERYAVYRVLGVTSADTISVSGDFSRVEAVSAFDLTRSEAFFTPSIAGTTLTLTLAGLALDTVMVTVVGSGA